MEANQPSYSYVNAQVLKLWGWPDCIPSRDSGENVLPCLFPAFISHLHFLLMAPSVFKSLTLLPSSLTLILLSPLIRTITLAHQIIQSNLSTSKSLTESHQVPLPCKVTFHRSQD